MKNLSFLILLFGATLLSPSCLKEVAEDFCNPTLKFDPQLFIENIREKMTATAGYQLVISVEGNLFHSEAGGFSIYDADPGGPIPMDVTTRMNVASVSKFIGTIALMQVLEKQGISIEQPIHNYLPDRWKSAMHPDHFDAGSPTLIRFRNLLRMETGIQFPGNDFSPGIMPSNDQMLDAISQPADAGRLGVYQNGNFTLIRILIGELEYQLDETANDYDVETAETYFDYIQSNIFLKLNLFNLPLSVDAINNYYAGNFTRAHQWPFLENFRGPNNNLGWPATSSPLINGGSGGLVLSGIELAKILAFFKHDNSGVIISAAQRDIILENELGLLESIEGANGRYLSKGGLRGPDAESRALRSRIVFYPNGIEVALLTNSNVTDMGIILRKSYDEAWVTGC